MKKVNNTKTEDELKRISEALEAATEYNLSSEVVWAALNYLKKNSGETIASALNHALMEWDVN